MNENTAEFLSVSGIGKKFRIAKRELEVLKDVTFSVRCGEWIALLGASGSGKTTLLDILGTISTPDAGSIVIGGTDVRSLSARALVNFRRKNIGFVFQSYHLLPELNIVENVMLPMMLSGERRKMARARAEELLRAAGLADRFAHRANELSGGEQQRVAIARALGNRPPLLLADEPTGNLDSVTGQGILELFQEIRRQGNTAIVMVTHDRSVAALADRAVTLRDGIVVPEL